jgi:purine-nucleoside phosphorylase
VAMADNALKAAGLRTIVGATWTTDAPFRETAEAIEAAKRRGILAVEIEAAALYTFAKARQANVLCIAHVTNAMGQAAQDFEKGEADGTADAMQILQAIVKSEANKS